MTPAVIDVDELGSIDPGTLVAAVAEHGAVRLRGGGADAESLKRLSDRCCDRFTADPGKVVVGGWRGRPGTIGRAARGGARAVARVRRRMAGGRTGEAARFAPFGGFGINPHTENSFLPDAAPEVVWFACLRAADRGGDSILSDGVEVLARLDDDTARFVRTTPVRYESRLTEPQWRSVWHDDDLDSLARRLDTLDGVTVLETAGGDLHLRYDAVQIGTTRFGGVESVQTNLLSRHPYRSVGREHDERLTDGSRVDDDTLRRILDATAPACEVRLEAGDVLVIDNTRVMHGRTPFDDTARRVVTRCGWWRHDVAAA